MLLPTTFDAVAAHARGTHADGLVLSQATATHWYMDSDGRGFVGVKRGDNLALVISALFVHPSERGMGHGDRILRDVMVEADDRDIEIAAEAQLHCWLGRHGFIAVRKLKKTAWLLRRPVALSS